MMCLSTGSPSPRRTHHTSRSSKHSASHQQHSASHQQHEQVREETSRERKSATRSGCQYSSKRTGKLTRQRSVESWAAEDEHDARREMKRREYAGLSTGYKESSYNHSDNNSRHRISLYGTYYEALIVNVVDLCFTYIVFSVQRVPDCHINPSTLYMMCP